MSVAVPDDFNFPFEPYDIQVDFMKELYSTLEDKKLGIFESPTGTGKSLSLICGTLTWLQEHYDREKSELQKIMDKNEDESRTDENNWFEAYSKKIEVNCKRQEATRQLTAIESQETRLGNMKEKRKTEPTSDSVKILHDDKFMQLFENINDDVNELKAQIAASADEFSADDDLIVHDYNSDDDAESNNTDADNDEEFSTTKVYFCSRTHSQLTQFIREVKKSPFGRNTRVTTLGSRQNTCINKSVSGLKSVQLMNDKCLELQRNKKNNKIHSEDGTVIKKRKAEVNGCPYYKQRSMEASRDAILTEVQDIEQVVETGKKFKGCPYYAARYAVKDAQVVAIPYNLLLHKSARESCKLNLKNNIVIIDEAHNLLDTISHIHSCEVNGAQLCRSYSQLTQYLQRFLKRLRAKNIMYLKQLLFIISSFVKYFGGNPEEPCAKLSSSGSRIESINEFLIKTNIDNINLYKVLNYCKKSEISKKLHGFVEKYQNSVKINEKSEDIKGGLSSVQAYITQLKHGSSISEISHHTTGNEQLMSSPLFQIETFFLALTSADKDGRIMSNVTDSLKNSSVKFILLNPSNHFKEIVNEARSVIVAGGTMQPIDEFRDQLFLPAGASIDRISYFSCGHVIPSDNLLPLVLSSGPTGVRLEFTHRNKNDPAVIDELGRIVVNLCNIVPGGIVLFFASYEYEKLVYNHWEKSETLTRIRTKKKIFREPKKANEVDKTLEEYTKVIKTSKLDSATTKKLTGALILSVVGGKLSEGINFSDDLGRCVVMVGMPYPNIESLELKEKMEYLNKNTVTSEKGRLPGQVHYENLCMKAVNQSIGRAIRHRNDYASIVLIDERYSRSKVKNSLPKWIASELKIVPSFGAGYSAICKFFSRKKTKGNDGNHEK